MKKVTFLLFALICTAAIGVNAQTYNTAIGAKFYTGNGSVGGINIKHSLSSDKALEGSLLFYNGGIGVEGLYEFQGAIRPVEGLSYYVGGGGLLGSGGGNGKKSSLLFALRLTGGVDYKFADAPISVSLGFDPFFYLSPSTGSNLALGIGLRYVLP
ncbi:MAG: hypothetical protein ABI123_06260 [Ginsengibacter sp.]